ncbi:type VI secretion system baseplate subunit TssG [Pseudoduganella lutea]|uniref:Type VI secretion system baseplate subunit TssG n=1 Tax=Pseudoduganella lutea TaxID=321985 RepID=A0A4P6L2Z6_9BURK|nr:type VI secretion system baseplate subunit TssG [Pseudoduganella lutea]QBE65940.1 type VI secretion system baseplate subunit TssG [Pseudoduganella lutea]
MQPAQRRFEPAVIERLFAQPYRFEYFQAVRMLELWLKRHGKVRDGAVANFLRFTNSTSLAFPASQLEGIEVEPRDVGLDRHALAEALKSATLRYVRITPAFMGLLGNMGALPAHYTERIAAHAITTRDDGPRAFLDTFSNRSLALFYEAWRKYRLELKYQLDGKDGFLPLLLSLAGLGQPSLRSRFADGTHGGLLDESVAYFATAMRHRPASSAQIARVLSEYFAVPVKTEQFIGRWYDMPEAQQCRLGMANAMLGGGAMAGARIWQRDLRLRIVIGPLKRARFDAFLPGGEAARALASMLSMMTGVSLEYEVQLVLCAREVQGASLADDRSGGRLGWDTFLVTGDTPRNRDDVRYDVHAL